MTQLTEADVTRIGEILLNAVSAMSALGHVNPALSTVYMSRDDTDPLQAFVFDVLASCRPVHDGANSPMRRSIAAFTRETGWDARCAEAAGRVG